MGNTAIPLEEFGVFKCRPENAGCMGSSNKNGWAFRDLGNDEVGIRCATMEAGQRSKWHVHSNGAHVIACVAGKAWLQIDGQEPVALSAGQAMSVPAGVRHWHGAAPDSRAQILVVHACPQGLAHEFFGPVPDEDYNALH